MRSEGKRLELGYERKRERQERTAQDITTSQLACIVLSRGIIFKCVKSRYIIITGTSVDTNHSYYLNIVLISDTSSFSTSIGWIDRLLLSVASYPSSRINESVNLYLS